MLVVLAALCVGVAGYLALAALERDEATSDARAGEGPAAADLAGARLIARAVDRDDPGRDGALLVVKGGRRQPAGGELACARVYFAGGRGLCLAAVEGGPGYEATIFDSSLRALRRVPLAGLPSRARVSSDGRHGAATAFVDGHAYESPAGFSTVTTIFDMHTGAELGNLEEFAVTKDGRPFDAVDFNFWGVTFERANSDRFYATLHTGSHYYLVEGSVWRRAMRVLRDGVECPSISPDGTRIAFKSRIGDGDRWRLKVLDLDTLKAHAVAERASFDDQAEWLDASTLVYSDRFDVYTVPAGGGGSRRLVVHDATSPVSLGAGTAEPVKPGSKAQAQGEG
jgi:hypothetical protein